MPLDDDHDHDHDHICVCVCVFVCVRARALIPVASWPTVLLNGWLGADNFIVGGIGPRIHE